MAGDQGDEIAHLKIAIEHRTTIGIALEILIERFGMSRDQAFDYLQRISSTHEPKLYDVARGLVEIRKLPEEPSASR